MAAGEGGAWRRLVLAPGESYRLSIVKAHPDDRGAEIAMAPPVVSQLLEVFDRAHFPTVSIETARQESDRSPLPFFTGQQVPRPAAAPAQESV
jgi:pyruvate formate lyase activating enzyme